MKKIELSTEGNRKYEAIKQLVEQKGNKKRIAVELGITERQVNRLIIGYKECGKEFFIHGNKGRKPENALDEKIKKLIKDLYHTKYYGCNLEHYSELLEKHEDIKISSNTIRTIFKEAHCFLVNMVDTKSWKIFFNLWNLRQNNWLISEVLQLKS